MISAVVQQRLRVIMVQVEFDQHVHSLSGAQSGVWQRPDQLQAPNDTQRRKRPPKTPCTISNCTESPSHLYYSVLKNSLECGFDAEQVISIWQTASCAYSAGQLRIMFEGIVKNFHSTKMYHDYYHTDVTHLQSLFKPPINILKGEGAVAIRTLANVKDQYDKKAFIWIDDFDWASPIGSWADLTYALLERLVKDGLTSDDLRCKLFARDLGL